MADSPPSAPSAIANLPGRIASVNESLILEIAARAMSRPDSIRLHAGESDEPTPGFIVDAANDAMRRGETRYVLSRGIQPLRDAIAAYLARTYKTPVDAQRVTVTVGGMQAISQSLLAIAQSGDEVLIPVPVWPNIIETTRIAGATPVPVPMSFDASLGWSLDLDALKAAAGPRTRAVFVNSPGNPTGSVLPEATLRKLLTWCRERGIWIIADEVYGRLVYPDAPTDPTVAPSFLPLVEPEDRVLVTNTMSKNWSMTGWRVGWVVSPPSMGTTFDNLMQYGSTGATTFAQHAAVVALNDGDEHISQMVDQCRIGRDIVCNALADIPGMRLAPPAGAFYVFFSPAGVNDSRQFTLDLLDATGVSLSPGAAFHASGEGWVRLCFGVSHATLREAAGRLRQYLVSRG